MADGPRSAALVLLLAMNGLRVSEVVGADVDHLDTERGHRVSDHPKGREASDGTSGASNGRGSGHAGGDRQTARSSLPRAVLGWIELQPGGCSES